MRTVPRAPLLPLPLLAARSLFCPLSTHPPAFPPSPPPLPPPRTPAGYSRTEAARHPLPLLLLNDGQNLFDDRLSFSGCSWRAAEAAAHLITSGQLPPFLLVGIDHAGADR